MELQEWWDIEYSIIPIDEIKYDKIVRIAIKNHSPFPRKFRIGVERVELKSKINEIRFRMYLDIFANPLFIEVDRYKKEIVDIKIPRLLVPDEGKIILYVENVDKKEKKTFEIFL